MSDTGRIVIRYKLGDKLRRDVFEDGTKTVEQYDYTDKGGNAVWETIVKCSATVQSVHTEADNAE